MRAAEARETPDRFEKRAARFVRTIGREIHVPQNEDHCGADLPGLDLRVRGCFGFLDEADDFLLRSDELVLLEEFADGAEQRLLRR